MSTEIEIPSSAGANFVFIKAWVFNLTMKEDVYSR